MTIFSHLFTRFIVALALIASVSFLQSAEVRLATEGNALLPIRVGTGGSEELVSLADELASYLNKITGTTFTVEQGGSGQAIVLGLRSDYPQYLDEPVKQQAPTWKERYRIVTDNGSVYIIGETTLAVQNGVFDFLHELGYRHYYPGENWEVIPQIPDLQVEVDRVEEPGFATRRLFYGTVSEPQARAIFKVDHTEGIFEQWMRKNRSISGFVLNTYHNWHRVARRHPEAFRDHPEWIAGKQDLPWEEADVKNWKFRVENPELRALIQKDAVQWLAENPDATSYSIDPTDGPGWPASSPIGSPSDQMVYLANDLIPVVQSQYPDRKVAFYAYYMHSPPPSLQLIPGAIVSVATGFINGGYTVEQLLQGWADKGAELGIREYVNVFFGSWDLPGRGYIGFDPAKHIERLRKYYNQGARYWIAELDNAWGVIGLSTYVGMRTMWRPLDGQSAEEIIDEFLQLCFRNAAEPLGRFHAMLNPRNKPLMSSDLVARMYDALLEGLAMEQDPQVRARILELAVYTRFAQLMHDYRNASANDQVDAYRALAEWSIRNRDTQMFQARGVFYRIGLRDERLAPVAREYLAKLGDAPTEAELVQIMTEQAATLQRIHFVPQSYSMDLRRIEAESRPAQKFYELSRRETLVWLAEKAGDVLELEIRGMGGRPDSAPNIVVTITHHEDPLEQPADAAEIIPDRSWHKVRLKAQLSGAHYVSILDPSNYLEIRWPAGTPIVFPMGQELGMAPRSRNKAWSGWFYVPAGTEVVAGYAESNKGRITDASGKVIYEFSAIQGTGYFEIPLDGILTPCFLKMEGMDGKRLLMTVPPYVARSPDELIIPAEILSTNP